jgi:uncharacterized cupredoxin-like copper-binding protein
LARKLPLAVVWMTLAVLLLIGCGIGDGGGTPGSDDGSIQVTMKDTMTFEPSAITVKAGHDVTIDLRNGGSIPHNFSIEQLDVSQTLEPGESANVTFSAPLSPGQYRIVCDEPGHEEAGMVGTLTVER